jgi:lysozyme
VRVGSRSGADGAPLGLGRWRGPSGRADRRRRRVVLLSCLLVLALAAAFGWFMALPRYRPPLRGAEHYGIDVSNHQGTIDWPAVAGDDVTAVYIKATEGQTFVDNRFAANWAGAASAGLQRGAYQFFSLCSPRLGAGRQLPAGGAQGPKGAAARS